MSRFLRLLAPTVLLASACNNSSAPSTTFVPATGVAVDPADFLGSVACLAAPGAMQSYVATLYPVSGSPRTRLVRGAPIQSSAPTPCYRSVVFQDVVVNQQYIAEIDGYELPPTELAAQVLQGRAMNRILPDGGAGGVAQPRWQTLCGLPRQLPQGAPQTKDGGSLEADARADAGTIRDAGTLRDASAIRDAQIAPAPRVAPSFSVPLFDASGPIDASCVTPYVFHPLLDGSTPELNGPVCVETQFTGTLKTCNPLVDLSGSPSVTGVDVNVGLSLSVLDGGESGCALAAGTVGAITVKQVGSNTTLTGACASAVEFSDVEPGVAYTFTVAGAVATDAGAVPAVTKCYATAIAGVIVQATCDPFVTP